MNNLDNEKLVKLKRQALKLILIALSDPSVSQINKETEKFKEAWERSQKSAE